MNTWKPPAAAVPFRSFAAVSGALACLYLVQGLIYAFRIPRSMDEFGHANVALRLLRDLPYRDFCPPKTVFGYYFAVPPLRLLDDPWHSLTTGKVLMVLLTAAVLLVGAWSLRRHVGDRAAIASLALMVTMSTYVERSGDFRPDTLASLLGFLSLLALLRRYPALAGVLAALSFLTTQKGIYFIAAGGAAVLAIVLRDRSGASLRQLTSFAAGCGVTISLYFGVWAVVASPEAIGRCMFAAPSVVVNAFQDVYIGLRPRYWSQTIVRNPFFYAITFAALPFYTWRWLRRRTDFTESLVTPYAVAVLGLALWHKQPWPYFFVMVIPTFYVVNAFLLRVIDEQLAARGAGRAATVLLLLLTAAPLAFRLPTTLGRDNGYQQATFRAASEILPPGERYIDGVSLLYHRSQAIPALFWVDASAATNLAALSDEKISQLLHDIDAAKPRLVIWSYRMSGLPARIQNRLIERYAHLYGSVFLYAPVVQGPNADIWFDGDYAIETSAPLRLNGTVRMEGEIVTLRAGAHSIEGGPARLRLLPPPGLRVDTEYVAPREIYSWVLNF